MSLHSNLENALPDSVRTLGHLESIEEEEHIFHDPKSVEEKEAHPNKTINNLISLDREKTLLFRSAIFNESSERPSGTTKSGEFEKNKSKSDCLLQAGDDSSFKVVGIDDDDNESGDFYLSDDSKESKSPELLKSNLERWKNVESLKDIIGSSQKLSITATNESNEAQQTLTQEKPKKSKWSLFFKSSNFSKNKDASLQSSLSVPNSYKKKLSIKRFLTRSKAPVSEPNKNHTNDGFETIAYSDEKKSTGDTHTLARSIQAETARLEKGYKLGSGGHSVVHLAIRQSDQKKVVAKYIQCVSVWHWHTDPETGADIPLEVQMLRRFFQMNSPGIIKYYEHFDLGSQFVIIMEYLGEDWVDLYDYIEMFGPVCEREANEIFTRIVNVVSYLHNYGYSHNDIKDENVMINVKTRQIKLIDFGSITKLQNGVTHNTFYGTRKFQSPEAIKGTYLLEYQEVWALGTLYYVLLFKMDPFKNDDEVLQVDISKRMERIRHFGVDGMLINVSDEAIISIKKMLDRDWTARPKVCEILSLPAFKKQE